MKILFSLTFYHPYVSGLTLAASRWAEGLAVQGETVTVLAMQHEQHLKTHERIHGISVERASWIVRISKGFVSLDWLVKSWRLVSTHDVVVIHLPQFEGIVPAIFAKLQGKRVVAVYHCEIALPAGFFNGVIQAVLEVSHFGTLWLADRVVTYTKDYARHSRLLTMLKWYGKGTVTAIVPPVPRPQERKIVTRELQKRIGQSSFVIGIAARLAAEKGIEYVLGAIALIQSLRGDKEITLAFAGSMNPVGEMAYKHTIMKLVKKYKKYVVFLDEINPKDMGSFYALLDVLVLPSVNSTESFGLVQVEAMLSGVPVVASDLPGVRVPVMKTGMGIVVPPKDSTAIATAIAAICKTPEAYTKHMPVAEKQFSQKRSSEAFRRVVLGKSYENND